MATRRSTHEAGAAHGGRRIGSHVFLLALVVYFILPLWWLVVASTKTNSGLFTGSGGPLWFDSDLNLIENLKGLGTHQGGIYWRWFGNSFLYAFSGGLGATILAVLAGYGFAKYRFRAVGGCSSPCCWARSWSR